MSEKINHYTGEFKQEVVEYMLEHHLGENRIMQHFPEIKCHSQPGRWLRIYQEEGAEALYKRRKSKSTKGKKRKEKPPSFEAKQEETMKQRIERLEAENAYLKKLQALIQS
jgi:transposase-like protein